MKYKMGQFLNQIAFPYKIFVVYIDTKSHFGIKFAEFPKYIYIYFDRCNLLWKSS
jgi:hypothetical protein